MAEHACRHVGEIREVVPQSKNQCDACKASGDDWVNLRVCLICGHVGCCDESNNKHATRHFQQTGHAVMQSFEPGETWRWCFACRVVVPEADIPMRR